jgi:hypothetical protein
MLLPRPASGELTPALLCVALVGGLAAQFAWPITTEFSPTAPPSTPRLRSPAATLVPDYPALLRAPLFSPDRHSLGVGVGGEGAAATDSQRPILIGVASDRRAGSAVVKGSDGAVHVIRLGEAWRGWRLVAVGAKGAAFDGPGGRFTARVGDTPPSASAPAEPSTSQEDRL